MQLIKMSIYQNKSIAIESASEMSSQRVAGGVCVADWFAGKTVCAGTNQTMNQTAAATAFLRPVRGWSAILH
jgi:hypothetical protein